VSELEFCTSIDTGRILVTVLGMVGEMERRFIRKQPRAGIGAARGEGSVSVAKAKHRSADVAKLRAEGLGASALARQLGMGRASAIDGG
jgi:DNA invertase Pin-like site-specific DNA recombinase